MSSAPDVEEYLEMGNEPNRELQSRGFGPMFYDLTRKRFLFTAADKDVGIIEQQQERNSRLL